MIDNKNKKIDDIINITEEKLRPIVLEIRKLLMEIDPNVCEIIRIGDRAASYSLGFKKMSESYCYIIPHKSWVNLGFYQGAHLYDPSNLLEGSGKNMRHVKIRTMGEVNQKELRALIETALKERKEFLNY